jgi:hypothetical protein
MAAADARLARRSIVIQTEAGPLEYAVARQIAAFVTSRP